VYAPAADGVKFRLLWCVLPVDILALVECVATTAPDEFTTWKARVNVWLVLPVPVSVYIMPTLVEVPT
jgi:hypothetical protein